MRIGLLYPDRDAVSPANWSGTPAGLAGGLAALGAEVVPIGAALPFGIHQGVAVLSRAGGKRGAVADRTPVRQRSRTWALHRRMTEAAASGLDGVIAMGTEMYDLAAVRVAGVPIVTYDDATFAQMWRSPDSDLRLSGFPPDEVATWIARQRASSRAADGCSVSTSWAARSMVEDYGIPSERVTVAGMGHRPRATADASAPRDYSEPRFLFIGVDWRRKNGDAVLSAFQDLRRTHPGARLDVVGRHERIEQPGVVDHGFLPREDPGAQRLLDGLFARATAFVLPSRFDPSPIAYLEAASAGLPVVATSEGGAGELLGEAAITVHPDDGDALRAALHRLADPVVARALGAEAARRAAHSSWRDVAGRLVDALTPARAAEPAAEGGNAR
jgi:glycosyltransferase involved in cell wall biosynthesis